MVVTISKLTETEENAKAWGTKNLVKSNRVGNRIQISCRKPSVFLVNYTSAIVLQRDYR